MASRKPSIHGRDHLPGGADPIPGLHTLIAETAAPVHAEGRYQIAAGGSVTVASGLGAVIDWEHISGDALLDLTDPAGPTPVTSGWYTVDAEFSSPADGSWTVGSMFWATLQFQGLQLKSIDSSVTVPIRDHPSGGDGFTGYGFISLSGHLRSALDTITLQLNNYDDASRVLQCPTILVSMVYATT